MTDDATRTALSRERIDLLAVMVQNLRAALASAQADIACQRTALQNILAIAEARADGTWDDAMHIARAGLEDAQ